MCEYEGSEALDRVLSCRTGGISTAIACVVRRRFDLAGTPLLSKEVWDLVSPGVLSRFILPGGELSLEILPPEASPFLAFFACRWRPPDMTGWDGRMLGDSGSNDGL